MRFQKILAFKVIIGTLVLLLFSHTNIFPATKTWVGSTTEWSTASNWSPSGVPVSGDVVIIPTTPFGGNMPTISSGTFATGQLTVQSGATLTQTGGELTFDTDNALIYGTFSQSGGTLLANNKDLLFQDGGSLIQSGTGVIHMNTSTGLTPAKGVKFKDNGGGAATGSQEGSAIIRCKDFKLETSNCTFTQSGSSLLTIDHDYKNNGGTFISTGGTIQFTGSGGNGPLFDTGTNQFYNVIIDDGVDPKFDNDTGGIIKVAGNFTNNNPDLDVTTATFTFNGSGDQTIYSASTPLPATSTFGNLVIDKPSGTIQLLSDVAVENTFTETNGTLDLNSNILWVNGSPLPVELSSFSAVILEYGIKLKWRTETEVSNYGFDVERTTPLPPPYQGGGGEAGGGWEKIGFVEGHGNSNSPKDYSFIDENITVGKPAFRTGRYSYRLKQIDTDGKFEYSKVIEVDLGAPINYELSQNYPNPFNPSTTIRFSVSESSFINLSIFNSLGEKIEELVNGVKEPGIHIIEFYAENLPSGTYFYRINSDNYTNIKKMVLVK